MNFELSTSKFFKKNHWIINLQYKIEASYFVDKIDEFLSPYDTTLVYKYFKWSQKFENLVFNFNNPNLNKFITKEKKYIWAMNMVGESSCIEYSYIKKLLNLYTYDRFYENGISINTFTLIHQ